MEPTKKKRKKRSPNKRKDRITTSAKITPKVRRPKLTDEENRQNARHRSSVRYIKMLKRGYRAYNVWIPDEIRKEIQAVVRLLVDEHEMKKIEGSLNDGE